MTKPTLPPYPWAVFDIAMKRISIKDTAESEWRTIDTKTGLEFFTGSVLIRNFDIVGGA